MPPEVIGIPANNISREAEEIIGFLNSTNTAEVIYFHGLAGLGASAVLKEVVRRLRSSSTGVATGTTRGVNKIIHIDCSLWLNKRALQKAIAEELGIPREVMAFFSQYDEEDDFKGLEEGARGMIPDVTRAIWDELHNHRFLVVFHNGSGNYIDLREFGIPVMGLMSKRVLWTSQGRFRLLPEKVDEDVVKEVAGLSDVFIYNGQFSFSRSWLYAEAEEVAKYTSIPEPYMSPMIVIKCIWYTALRVNDSSIDWGTHASNYWVCDGIIQASTDGSKSAWEIGDALRRNINLGWNEKRMEIINLGLSNDEKERFRDRWIFASDQYQQDLEKENNHDYASAALQVPSQATSFFWTVAGSSMENNAPRMLETSMFKHSDSLRVIHLSQCTFSFSSPPFSSCKSLRFLLLDHCKDKDATPRVNCSGERKHHDRYKSHDRGACFRKVWVLHLSFTDWHWLLSEDAMDLMAELRELNVKGVTNWSISHLCRNSGAERDTQLVWACPPASQPTSQPASRAASASQPNKLLNLVTLRVTGKPTEVDSSDIYPASPLVAFPDLSSSSNLKTIVLDGCVELEKVGLNVLPQQLESFSFTSNVNTKIKSMCFRGCTKLEYVLLKGLFGNLVELDISGTTIRSLDLSATAAPNLRQLFLLGCEKLRAILWPKKGQETELNLMVLHIDTTQASFDRKDKSTKEPRDDTIAGSSSAMVPSYSWAPIDFHFYIFLRDARFLWSLLLVTEEKSLHIENSSTTTNNYILILGGGKGARQGTTSCADGGECQGRAMSLQKQAGNLYGDSITATFKDNSQDIREMWPCPSAPPCWGRCFIGIQETRIELPHGTASGEQGTRGTVLPSFVSERAEALYLHDSFSITSTGIPRPAANPKKDLCWVFLRWCRLERCPNLEGTVFTAPYGDRYVSIFDNLKTFWASQLAKALYIWDWSTSLFRPRHSSFWALEFLHIDCCPRLIHVLPLCDSNGGECRRLKTLEIVCCGNLKEVFPLVDYSASEEQEGQPRAFPHLERIHLHELPKLERICGRRMDAPNLKTVKIRGCWSLKSLPAVRLSGNDDPTPPPEVDCEKEWWDGLEWDGHGHVLEFSWGTGRLLGHDPSVYKASHSQYHKKTLLRANVLR
ncbi:hypothetical protein ACP70R_015316 [Stipagrostis hirtigluma subsp. patula]